MELTIQVKVVSVGMLNLSSSNIDRFDVYVIQRPKRLDLFREMADVPFPHLTSSKLIRVFMLYGSSKTVPFSGLETMRPTCSIMFVPLEGGSTPLMNWSRAIEKLVKMML